jgi:signal transduction histidine kinase
MLNREVLKLERLTADLLDAARIGTGRFEIRRRPTDLTREVQRAVQAQRAATPDYQIHLEAGEKVSGSWDPDRLGQVLGNLLSNAVKYSPAGGSIFVRVGIEGGQAVIEVSDQGMGIPPEQLSSLFQPFARLHTGQGISGTGLGLYIAEAIVAAHGGRLWAASEGRGKGTTFAFMLPRSYGSPPKPVPAFSNGP